MKADYTVPKELFQGERQLFVPVFQRPYSWKSPQWRDLWADLLALQKLPAGKEDRKHFLGSVVMHAPGAGLVGVSKFAVVDGQQRLMTLFLLLVALRDVARALGDAALVEAITETYLINKHATNPADRLKVLPVKTDLPALRQLVTPVAGALAPRGLLAEAYAFFRQEAGAWVGAQAERAHALRDLVVGRLSLVSITLNHDDDPYLVFESLNAKGVKLTAADLIRNYLFMRISAEQQDELNDTYWVPMQAALGDALTEFIRHYLMREGGNVAQSDVYGAFRRATEKREVTGVLQELARFAPTYARILHPALETDRPDLQRALLRSHLTRLTVAYPLVLRLYDQIRHGGGVAETTLLAVLDALENFVLRSFITRRNTAGANKSLQVLTTRTSGLDTDAAKLLHEARTYLASQGFPPDEEVREKLLTEVLYHHVGERNARTRLLLETLERTFNPKEVVLTENLSIEHVMPQTLTPAWLAALAPDAAADHAALLHTLGNLTLTGYNPEMSNKSFAEKQVTFAESNLSLNAALAAAPQWNAAAIRARSTDLAERFLARYPALAAPTKPGQSAKAPSVKPIAVGLYGQKWEVKTWIDVALVTLRACHAFVNGTLFPKLHAQKPTLLTPDPSALTTPRLLVEGWYYEGHGSADYHRSQCRWALVQAGIALTEWEVETMTPVV